MIDHLRALRIITCAGIFVPTLLLAPGCETSDPVVSAERTTPEDGGDIGFDAFDDAFPTAAQCHDQLGNANLTYRNCAQTTEIVVSGHGAGGTTLAAKYVLCDMVANAPCQLNAIGPMNDRELSGTIFTYCVAACPPPQ